MYYELDEKEQKIAQARKKKKQQQKKILLVLLLLATGAYFYFMVPTRTKNKTPRNRTPGST